jgi:hypothetical protein
MKSLHPLYIGLGLLVFIVGFSIYRYQEGFQTLPCSTNTNCANCAETYGCGWCSKAKKCVEQNRMGGPKKTCTVRTFITSATQCPQVRPSFLNAQVSNELTGAGAAATTNQRITSPSLIGGNCPTTDNVVKSAELRVTDIIKNVVKAEMLKYNVPLIEPFQTSQERDIATMLLMPLNVKDKVTNVVTKSIEAAGYAAPA